MSDSTDVSEAEFEQLLQVKAQELAECVAQGDLRAGMALIEEIQTERDKTLFAEVGKLTRTLHTAITNFHVDGDGETPEDGLSEMSDATDRLSYVVEMTEKAANKTLDAMDEVMPIAHQLGEMSQSMRDDWKRLRSREMSANEFREYYWKMDEFLDQVNGNAQTLSSQLSDVLLAQDFQDLTGQVIQKVTALVKEVETSLVNMISMASKVDHLAGVVHEIQQLEEDSAKGHGPQIDIEKEDVVTGQDDVDDLLSSLGF
jgi:chemotaxis protein CheZ